MSLGWKRTHTVCLLAPIVFSLRLVNETHFWGSLSPLLVCLLLRHLQSSLHSAVSEPSALSLAHSHIAHLESVSMRSCNEGQHQEVSRVQGCGAFFYRVPLCPLWKERSPAGSWFGGTDTEFPCYGAGYYFSGDGAHRTKGGYYQITGRMDDVINISGHRLGTAEIEDAMVSASHIGLKLGAVIC